MSQPAVNLAAPHLRRVRRKPRAPEIGPGSDVGGDDPQEARRSDRGDGERRSAADT
ncbi:MAG: hypothetical protein ACJ8AT_12635 [Hyalangium sp.]|uniref:hypothetical protein n=1 Tax=Hyalangium sp. TaxID=2028555 RepID=UPI0038997EEB